MQVDTHGNQHYKDQSNHTCSLLMMGAPREGRAALSDISNNINRVPPPVDEERKREEKKIKQCEYRARRKAEETNEQREERNRKQREYRARRKAESYNPTKDSAEPSTFGTPTIAPHVNNTPCGTGYSTISHAPMIGQQSPCGTGYSTILQASSIKDKENRDPEEPIEWLHRNNNYVRQYVAYDSFASNNSGDIMGSSNIKVPVGSSSKDKLINSRKRYINMDDDKKEMLLQKRREYKKARASINKVEKSSDNTLDPGGLTQDHTMMAQPIPQRYIEPNYIEHDSTLFEPAHPGSDEEDHEFEAHDLYITDPIDDDEARQFLGEGDAFESYSVYVNGVDQSNIEDPYDYIYQNLPESNVLRKVPDCQYCGAMRFQFEPPGFCCRKGKIEVHIPDVPW